MIDPPFGVAIAGPVRKNLIAALKWKSTQICQSGKADSISGLFKGLGGEIQAEFIEILHETFSLNIRQQVAQSHFQDFPLGNDTRFPLRLF